MKILLSAFDCGPGRGSESGNGWHWATALADYGHDVTVLTSPSHQKEIRTARPTGIDFHFIDVPASPLNRFSWRLGMYDSYVRWQDAALRHIEGQQQQQQYDVAHHVTWGSLYLGCLLWRLPVPLVFGPVGGGQTMPASYGRYLGRDWLPETVRTTVTGPLLKLNGRGRETIRNSAVTLACNSATMAAGQRLGGADIRYMMSDALSRDWLVSLPPATHWHSRGALGWQAIPAQGPHTCGPSIRRTSPGHAWHA